MAIALRSQNRSCFHSVGPVGGGIEHRSDAQPSITMARSFVLTGLAIAKQRVWSRFDRFLQTFSKKVRNGRIIRSLVQKLCINHSQANIYSYQLGLVLCFIGNKLPRNGQGFDSVGRQCTDLRYF